MVRVLPNPLSTSTGTSYNAWLLRVWREGAAGTWHASLPSIHGDAPVGFADLEQLFAHLLALTEAAGHHVIVHRPESTE